MSETNLEPPTISSNSTNSTIYFDAESHDEVCCNSEQCDGNCSCKMLLGKRMNGHDNSDENIDTIKEDDVKETNKGELCKESTTAKLNDATKSDSESSGVYEENIVGASQDKEATTEKEISNATPMAEAIAAALNSDDNSVTNSVSASEELALTHDPIWRGKSKHVFILSEAGKPIYSLHGDEDKLAILFGIIQALVSFVEHSQDTISSIRAKGIQFVFMNKSNLIFVMASRTNMSVTQLQMQLNDVHNQIISTLTYTQLEKIFRQRKNFDLRRLLVGSERLINNILLNDSSSGKITNNVFAFLTSSIRILPLAPAVRTSITNAIKEYCSKIKDLVFVILIAQSRLIALVQKKKYSIQPSDLRIIINLIECSESFKSYENWTPICLPRFDMNGYLHAHVSYLPDNSPACLLLLSVDRDAFFTLSKAKESMIEKMQKTQCLDAINEAVLQTNKERQILNIIGIPEIRHFLYRPKLGAQLLCSEIAAPYTALQEFQRLEAIYCDLVERVRNSKRPLKLVLQTCSSEVALAWSTESYEIYVVFNPLTQKNSVPKDVDKLIKWIDKEYDTYFIRTHPTF